MKLSIDAKAFAEAIAWAAKFLPSWPSVPVLAGIRLEAAGEHLEVSVFDYEVSARAELAAEIGEPGAVLVSGRRLAEISGRLRPGETELAIDGASLVLRSGPAAFTLLALPLEDYPARPAMPAPVGQVDSGALARASRQVTVAVAHDHTVPVLCSVGIDLSQDGPPMLSGTDRYRAALRALTGWQPILPEPSDDAPEPGEAAEPVKVLVYGPTMTQIAKALPRNVPVTVGLAAHDGTPMLLGVQAPGRAITTRLMDGDVLNIAAALDVERPHRVEVDTGEFLQAVRRVATVAERNTPVRLSFAAGEMTLQAGTGDEATGRDLVPALVHGEPPGVAFNPGYLADALTALDSDTVHLSLADSDSKSAMLIGTDPAELDEPAPYRHYLMPVRLHG